MRNKTAFAAIWILALVSTTAMARPSGGPDRNDHPPPGHTHQASQSQGQGHAHGRHHRANLQLANQFDGPVKLFANGRYVSTIPANSSVEHRLPSGWTHLQVRTANTGYVLSNTHASLHQNAVQVVTIRAPQTNLTVKNRGQEPLFVGVTAEGSMWLNPGQTGTLRVRSGNVKVTGQARRRGGLQVVETRVIFAEPGQANIKRIDLIPDPPPATLLTLRNNKHVPMMLTVDGRYVGRIEPGRTKSFQVQKGFNRVFLSDPWGNVHYNQTLHFERGNSTIVSMGRARHGGVVVARR